MDRVPSKILGGVAAKTGENPVRRRGQGSTTTIIRRGLVEPKRVLSRNSRKETQLIFCDPQVKASSRTPAGRGSGHMPVHLSSVAPGSTVMVRTGGRRDRVSARGLLPIRAVREKSRTATAARTEN
jgi:hypothetical protein